MTLIEMYCNIAKKFGKNSFQARRLKIYCETLPKGYHRTIISLYKMIMEDKK
jgi:hypothetical protein